MVFEVICTLFLGIGFIEAIVFEASDGLRPAKVDCGVFILRFNPIRSSLKDSSDEF